MLPPEIPIVPNSLNLQEERPMVFFGPHVEEVDPSTPPFYVSLVIHALMLHNCMLDSRASHNLMPLSVMEQLGLQITRPYKYLYSFDSKRVKCLGMIKYLVVNLAQIPAKVWSWTLWSLISQPALVCCCQGPGVLKLVGHSKWT